MGLLKKIIDLIFYSNLWIAACATAMTLQSVLIVKKQLIFSPLIYLVFFSTLFIYALHRIIGISKLKEFIEDYQRYQVIASFKQHISLYALLAGIGVGMSFWYLHFSVKLALVLPAIISLGYVLPLFKNGKRLRDVNHIKIYLIAIVWTWVTVGLVTLELQQLWNWPFFLMMLERAFFIFAITLPFDVRDLKVDKYSKIKTIPALIGIKKTKQLSVFILLLCFFLASINYGIGFYSSKILLGLSFSFFFTAIICWFSAKLKHDYFFTGLVDGTMLLQFLLVWAMMGF